jgi:hypothetical protein
MNPAPARALAGEVGGASRPSSTSPIGMDAMIRPGGLMFKVRSGRLP